MNTDRTWSRPAFLRTAGFFLLLAAVTLGINLSLDKQYLGTAVITIATSPENVAANSGINLSPQTPYILLEAFKALTRESLLRESSSITEINFSEVRRNNAQFAVEVFGKSPEALRKFMAELPERLAQVPHVKKLNEEQRALVAEQLRRAKELKESLQPLSTSILASLKNQTLKQVSFNPLEFLQGFDAVQIKITVLENLQASLDQGLFKHFDEPEISSEAVKPRIFFNTILWPLLITSLMLMLVSLKPRNERRPL